jgi:hypothetical protein
LGDPIVKTPVARTISIHIDESGVPGIGVENDGLFVVGGVGVLEPVTAARAAWSAAMRRAKGAKRGDVELRDAAALLAAYNIVPIASHVRLNAGDIEAVRAKVAALNPDASVATYLWSLQLLLTVLPAALLALPGHFGDPDEVVIHVDRFNLPKWFRPRLARHLDEWFDINSGVHRMMAQLVDPQEIKAKVKVATNRTTTSLVSNGVLHEMADCVSALYRRKLKGQRGATEAWGILEARFQARGQQPECMGMDLLAQIRTMLRE